ncbi:MAG: hypothetical protein ACRYGF_06305 [Janthinobacterium lividum]
MTDKDWKRIDVTLHRLRIAVSENGSNDFRTQTFKKARDAAGDQTVYERLLMLAASSE